MVVLTPLLSQSANGRMWRTLLKVDHLLTITSDESEVDITWGVHSNWDGVNLRVFP